MHRFGSCTYSSRRSTVAYCSVCNQNTVPQQIYFHLFLILFVCFSHVCILNSSRLQNKLSTYQWGKNALHEYSIVEIVNLMLNIF